MSDWRDDLVAAARDVRKHAWCPYSNFAVGAALRDTDGNSYLGVNVENASYPVGVCAERSAISTAITAGSRSFAAVAVVTPASEPVAPCGMCRQALAEFGRDIIVLMAGPTGDWTETTIDALLPSQFDPAHLEET